MFPVDRGDVKPVVTLGVVAELRGRRGLHPQVQLSLHDAFEMRDHVRRPQPARGGRQQFDHRGRKVERVDVLAEILLDMRAQYLDGNGLAAGAQPRLVHLCDRGGGDRFTEVVENLFRRATEFKPDRGLRRLHRKRRQFVLQHA